MVHLFVKKWLFFFLLLGINLYIALSTSILFFYFFFLLLVSIALMSVAWAAINFLSATIEIKRHTIEKVFEDDEIDIALTIKNKGFLPVFNLAISDYLPCAPEGEKNKMMLKNLLKPKQQHTILLRCLCPQRGKYLIGPLSLYFFDPLGLFFLKKTVAEFSELYVYPRTFAIKKFPPLKKGASPWFGIEIGRSSGDDDEFHGIREYQSGDPIKRIHWFSTARKNKIIVKQFQRQVFYRATLMFNLDKRSNYGEGKKTVVEYIIKVAASIAKHLLENNVSLEIIAHTGEIAHINFNKGPQHLEDIMRFLATAQAESRVGLGDIFEEFVKFLPDDSSLIAIMLDSDWELLPQLVSLKKKNISIIPLIVNTGTFLVRADNQKATDAFRYRFAHAANIEPYFFSYGDDPEEKFM